MAETAQREEAQKRLYLIDGANLMFRAFHAIRSLTNSKGFPTNALYGFTAMLLKLVRDERPDYLAITFDTSGPTFRDHKFTDYKANRSEMPDDLRPQVPFMRTIAEGFRIPFLLLDGYEADDIIATLTGRALKEGIDVCIVSSDKDLTQLVCGNVCMLDTMADKRFDEDGVFEKWGVRPRTMGDYLALIGDTSDNIPGVRGIGPKTACKLLADYGDLDGIYANITAIKGATRTKLEEGRDSAYLSRELVELHSQVPLECTWEDLALHEPDREALTALFRELEFKTFLREFHAATETTVEEHQTTVLTEEQLAFAVAAIRASGRVSFDLVTTTSGPMDAEIVGIALAPSSQQAFYIPIAHRYLGAPRQLALANVLAALEPVLTDPAIEKLGQNTKNDFVILLRHGIEVRGVAFDSMLGSYLLDAGKYPHTLDNIALDWLNHKTITYEDVTGAGKKQRPFEEVEIEVARAYGCEDALLCSRLVDAMRPDVESEGLGPLMRDVEIPLSRVLAGMELHGVLLDVPLLRQLSAEMASEMTRLEAQIWDLAGERFAIGSPKQIGEILFGRLGLPKGKRTKTGWSTDQSVLEELAREQPICAAILEWRANQKLKSTYCDALPLLVNRATGRIHTSFNQAVAATGRLSSSDPNLQNIPIRTELGRRIREAFIAAPGHALLSADYSQIELRLLAHIANDTNMIAAFRDGADIHTRTASEVFGVPLESVTSEVRNRAKAINFGIVYGMSAFRLSNDLGISKGEAQAYIDGYFERFPGVRAYLDGTIERARQTGEVATLLGRKRPVADLKSSNFNVRSAAERVAINTPIQGSAADLIKVAMIRVSERLEREQRRAAMVLQVHDELVFEVPEDELAPIRELVRQEMEGVMELSVPLVVDVHAGRTWSDAHG